MRLISKSMRKVSITLVLALSFAFTVYAYNLNEVNPQQKVETTDYVLQISVDKLLYQWAGKNRNDTLFQKVFQKAISQKKYSKESFIDLMAMAWKSQTQTISLSRVYAIPGRFPKLSAESSTKEVVEALHAKLDKETKAVIKVLELRIEYYGLSSFKVEKGAVDQIHVQANSVENVSRFIKILVTPASLEFMPTYDFFDSHIYTSVLAADNYSYDYYKYLKNDSIEESIRLFSYLKPNFVMQNGNYYPGDGPILGYVFRKDTAKVNAMLKLDSIKKLFPNDAQFLWGVKTPAYLKESKGASSSALELFIIRSQNGDGKTVVSNACMSSFEIKYSNTDQPMILISMNKKGAQLWKELTGANLGKSLAVVIDKKVISVPKVQAQISGGRSMISGGFEEEELNDYVIMFNGGRLNLSLNIVLE